MNWSRDWPISTFACKFLTSQCLQITINTNFYVIYQFYLLFFPFFCVCFALCVFIVLLSLSPCCSILITSIVLCLSPCCYILITSIFRYTFLSWYQKVVLNVKFCSQMNLYISICEACFYYQFCLLSQINNIKYEGKISNKTWLKLNNITHQISTI